MSSTLHLVRSQHVTSLVVPFCWIRCVAACLSDNTPPPSFPARLLYQIEPFIPSRLTPHPLPKVASPVASNLEDLTDSPRCSSSWKEDTSPRFLWPISMTHYRMTLLQVDVNVLGGKQGRTASQVRGPWQSLVVPPPMKLSVVVYVDSSGSQLF